MMLVYIVWKHGFLSIIQNIACTILKTSARIMRNFRKDGFFCKTLQWSLILWKILDFSLINLTGDEGMSCRHSELIQRRKLLGKAVLGMLSIPPTPPHRSGCWGGTLRPLERKSPHSATQFITQSLLLKCVGRMAPGQPHCGEGMRSLY